MMGKIHSTARIKIGLIGAGRAGMIHGRNFKAAVPNAQITAIADPNEETAAAAAEELEVCEHFTDYHDMLEGNKVDAVVVVTPTKYHCEIVKDAALAGKHILCEKPMAMNVDECFEMQRAVDRNGVKLQMAFMRRFDAGFAEAKRVVDGGAIGQVVMVRSNTRGPSIPQAWMYDISESNGPLAEVNSHDIDTLRWFTESEFSSLYAIGGNYRCLEARENYPDFYDNVIMSATFANGMQGMIDGAQGVRYGYDARVEILGTNGCIFLGRTNEYGLKICTSNYEQKEEFVHSWKCLFKDAYLNEDIAFVQCVLDDTQPMVTGHDGAMAVKVVNAGNISIREKRVVFL